MPRNSNYKSFHIICKKPEELVKYGFKEDEYAYRYWTESKAHEIAVWKARRNRKHYKVNRMTFPMVTPRFTMEIAYLMATMLKDDVIEFEVETREELKLKKIAKLEEEIRQLKGEK